MSNPSAFRILVIEDDPDMRAVLSALFQSEGHVVTEAASGELGLEFARSNPPDIVILDVHLPGISGHEVCRRLRTFTTVPVLFLTAATDETDELVGFAAGGDDYVAKPFAPQLVAARVQALLRRSNSARSAPTIIEAGNVSIDLDGYSVTVSGHEVELTKTELGILATLARNRGRTVGREQLLEAVWGPSFGDDHVIDVNLSRLRTKLTQAGAPERLIVTHRGIGYRLNVSPES